MYGIIAQSNQPSVFHRLDRTGRYLGGDEPTSTFTPDQALTMSSTLPNVWLAIKGERIDGWSR